MSIATPPRTSPAIPVFHATRLHIGTLPWKIRPPKASVTVIVKSTCDLAIGQAAIPVVEHLGLRIACGVLCPKPRSERDADPLSGDVAYPTPGEMEPGDRLSPSLRYASDFTVLKPRADITLVGTARAAKPVRAMRVAFRFGHPGNSFHRRMAVIGDRNYVRDFGGLVPGEPTPFTAMPLVYERAFGGHGWPQNAVGRGIGARAGDPLPNLEDPAALVSGPSDRPLPIGFGPIPLEWPERWGQAGTFDEAWLRARWPHFPEDAGEAFFQAAPADQQLAWLTGDEPFEVRGMHPVFDVWTGSLPGILPQVVAEEKTGRLVDVALRLDTAHFDFDEMKLCLLWRGVMEVSDDEASEIQALFVHEGALSDLPLSEAAVRERALSCLLPKRPARPSPEPVPPAPPAEDPPLDEREMASLREREQDLSAKLRDLRASVPEPPPAPEGAPDEIAAALRRAKVPEEEIATLLSAMERAEDKPPPAPPEIHEEVLRRLAAGQPLDGLDLSDTDFGGIDFRGVSAKSTKFCRARLARAAFDGADLTGAVLTSTNLESASLRGTELRGADFHRAVLTSADLSGAAVERACFSSAEGKNARFEGARGARADFADGAWGEACFDGADLPGADFSRAALGGASFRRAKMPEARLFDARGEGACFDDAELPRARADGCAFRSASFRGAVFEDAVAEGSDFEGAAWFGGRLQRASFVRANCRGAVFSACDVRQARFSRASLRSAAFLRANAMEARFDRADLEGADLRGASLFGAELFEARIEGIRTDLALLGRTTLRGPS